jgi:hypothetical protein
MRKNEKSLKPFGIEHLVEVPVDEAKKVNGGMRTRHYGPQPKPPIFHTNYISLPSGAFPSGDHG